MPGNHSHNRQRKGWNPAHTRIFDVFINDGSSENSQLDDIFSYDTSKEIGDVDGEKENVCGPDRSYHDDRGNDGDDDDDDDDNEADDDDEDEDEEESDASSSGDVQLVNSGTGRRTTISTGYISKHNNSIGRRKEKKKTLILPLEKSSSDPNSLVLTPKSCTTSKSYCSLSKIRSTSLPSFPTAPLSSTASSPGGDKWSPQVENVFLAALRIIMKNGTSKIKINDRNYGRNELISLFIRHKVGEYRTKKQISSHIQVWKKSILNKVSNGIETSPLEKEILRLIEYGVPQTTENWKTFEDTFKQIISSEENEIDTPKSELACLPPNMVSSNPSDVSQPIQPQFSNANPGDMRREPSTPLEYAQEVYGNLKSYKCVPVNMQDHFYPFFPIPAAAAQPQTPLSMKKSNSLTLQAAREVEFQQRKLIEEMFTNNSAGNSRHAPVQYGGNPNDLSVPNGVAVPIPINMSDQEHHRHQHHQQQQQQQLQQQLQQQQQQQLQHHNSMKQPVYYYNNMSMYPPPPMMPPHTAMNRHPGQLGAYPNMWLQQQKRMFASQQLQNIAAAKSNDPNSSEEE